MRKPPLYRKLAAGHRFGVVNGGWTSLHLGPDHLLFRSSSAFIERYRRFYFVDIEAITISKTIRGIFWNAGFAFGLFFSVVPIFVNRGPHIVAWSFSCVFALLLLVNVLRGPTCSAQLQTRVQRSALPLRRLRGAVRVVEQLSAPILAAQAEIPVASSSAEKTPSIIGADVVRPSEPPPLPGESAPTASWPLVSTFGLLIITAALALMSALRPQQPALAYLIYTMFLINLGLPVFVLARRRRRQEPPRLIPLTWASVLAHGIALPILYFTYNMLHTFQMAQANPGLRPSPTALFPLFALRGLPGFTQVLAGYAIFALLLGFAGCAWIVAFGARLRNHEPA